MGYWLGGFGVLAEGIFFPMFAFPLGNERKLFFTICDTEIGKTLPEDDCSEFMLGPLSVINCVLKDCK